MTDHSTAEELGSGKIGNLLLQYSIPAIVAMTASSLYNVIDRIFIGQGVGALAISGLALTLPIMNLAVAFGALVGIGASSMVSIRLGEGKHREATLILGNALGLNIVISIAFTIVVLSFLDQILYAFGASSDTLPYAAQFMHIILIGNIVTHVYMGLNHIMRASGYPRKAMVATLMTIGINIALAPIFIFGFQWGIRGAASATVCSQFAGMVLVFVHLLQRQSSVHFERGCMKLRMHIIKDIISVGIPSFSINICACLIISLINIKLAKYGGDFAVGAYGIINSILMLFVMITLGLTQGMQPIAGFNYGARKMDRVGKVFRYTIIAGTCLTTAGFLMGQFIPRLIARAFTTNLDLIDLSETGMRIVLAMFPLVGFQIVTASFFQSIGRARISVFLSLTRQMLLLIPALFVLPELWGLNGVWLAMPASDLSASVLTFIVLRVQNKNFRPRG